MRVRLGKKGMQIKIKVLNSGVFQIKLIETCKIELYSMIICIGKNNKTKLNLT